MNAQKRFMAQNWLKAAGKPKPDQKKSQAISMVCQVIPALIRCRNRLRSLAPRLFDGDVVEARLLRHIHYQTPRNADNCAATVATAREALAAEAWAALSSADVDKVRFQWHLCQALSEILLLAQERLDQEREAGQQFRLGAITRLMAAGFDLERSERLWLPSLPNSFSQHGLVPEASPANEAPVATQTPFPPAPDQKSIVLLERTRQWQSQLGLLAAA